MQAIGGRIVWDGSHKTLNPVPDVCTTPITGGRWVKGDMYPFDLIVVDDSHSPEVPTRSGPQPIAY